MAFQKDNLQKKASIYHGTWYGSPILAPPNTGLQMDAQCALDFIRAHPRFSKSPVVRNF